MGLILGWKPKICFIFSLEFGYFCLGEEEWFAKNKHAVRFKLGWANSDQYITFWASHTRLKSIHWAAWKKDSIYAMNSARLSLMLYCSFSNLLCKICFVHLEFPGWNVSFILLSRLLIVFNVQHYLVVYSDLFVLMRAKYFERYQRHIAI